MRRLMLYAQNTPSVQTPVLRGRPKLAPERPRDLDLHSDDRLGVLDLREESIGAVGELRLLSGPSPLRATASASRRASLLGAHLSTCAFRSLSRTGRDGEGEVNERIQRERTGGRKPLRSMSAPPNDLDNLVKSLTGTPPVLFNSTARRGVGSATLEGPRAVAGSHAKGTRSPRPRCLAGGVPRGRCSW